MKDQTATSRLTSLRWNGDDSNDYSNDDSNDDDDHVEAGGVQAYKRQAGREGTRRKDYTEAFQFGEQVCHMVFVVMIWNRTIGVPSTGAMMIGIVLY